METILFVYSSPINPTKGGVQKITYNLAKNFRKIGYNVLFLASENQDVDDLNQEYQSVLPNSINIESKDNQNYFLNLIISHNVNFVINQSGIDKKLSNLCLLVKKSSNAKFITVFHNSLLGTIKSLNFEYNILNQFKLKHYFQNLYTKKTFFYKTILFIYWLKHHQHYRRSLKKFDKCILLSRNYNLELSFFVKKIDFSKISYIPNALYFGNNNTNLLKENELLFVGRVDKIQKRIDVLLDVWKNIYYKFPNWKLIIVGEGPYKSEFINKINQEKIPRVEFYKRQDPEIFYKRAKLFCMTSAFEGWPLVIHEAQYFGVVPILFDSFLAASEMVNNLNDAILVKSDKTESYIENLSFLMQDEQYLNELSLNSKTNVLKYDIEIISKLWVNLFKEISKT